MAGVTRSQSFDLRLDPSKFPGLAEALESCTPRTRESTLESLAEREAMGSEHSSPSESPTGYSSVSVTPRAAVEEVRVTNDSGIWKSLPDGVTHLALRRTSVVWDALKPTIIALEVTNNNLTEIPEGLYLSTPRLKVLDLSHNRITRIIDTISGFESSLVKLDLSDNQISDIPESLYRLTSLEFLNLSNNKIKRVSISIILLAKLRFLCLSHNQLESLPDCITQMLLLADVQIEGNEGISLTQRVIDYFSAKEWPVPASTKLKVDRRATMKKSGSLFSFFGE